MEIPTQISTTDLAHGTTRSVLGAIPVLGQAAVEVFNLILTPPVEKRRVKWMEEVASAINELNEKQVDIKKLQENEQFVSAVLKTTQIAMITHQAEKIALLKNAILNIGQNPSLDATMTEIFLNYIDALSVWHIQLLCLLHDPVKAFTDRSQKIPDFGISSNLKEIVKLIYPELHAQEQLCQTLAKDLFSRGLIAIETLGGMMSADAWKSSRTTELGKSFLQLVIDHK